jgi:deoxyadenosine/deoxycytidine kinase
MDTYNRVMNGNARSDVILDAIVYIRTDPDVCLSRIRSRGRKEEVDAIDEDYFVNFLRDVHCEHEDWLYVKNPIHNYYVPQNVIVIDGNMDMALVEFDVMSRLQNLYGSM